MSQMMYLIVFIYLLPFQAFGQQKENVYLAFDKNYETPFKIDEIDTEYDIYGVIRDLIREYTAVGRLADVPSGSISDDSVEKFYSFFDAKSEVALDFANYNSTVSPQTYVSKARSAFGGSALPLIIDGVSIREIRPDLSTGKFRILLNLKKELKNNEDTPVIPLKMIVDLKRAEDGSFEKAVIQAIEAGVWETKQAAGSMHLTGLILGKSFLLGGSKLDGLRASNSWTAGFNYAYVRHMPWMDGRLNLVAGVRGKLSRFNSIGESGTTLNNGGVPNALQLEFLTEASELLNIWSAEALLGVDYVHEREFDVQKGLVIGLTPRFAAVSAGTFKGALAFNEVWNDQVLVRDIVNCGLTSFEGADAVDLEYRGQDYLRGLGILISPYYQFVNRFGWRLRMNLDIQYMFGSISSENNELFLSSVRDAAATAESGDRVQYEQNSLLRTARAGAGELFLGLNVNYFWPTEKNRSSNKPLKESPFAQDRLDDFDGKAYLILNGDITDAEAAARIKNELGPGTQFVWIINTTRLQNVVIPGVSNLLRIRVENNTQLQNVSFPELREVYDLIKIEKNPLLLEWHVPRLDKLYNLEFRENHKYQDFNLPQLRSTGQEMVISKNHALKSIRLPNLNKCLGDLGINTHDSLRILDLESLTRIGGALNISGNSVLDSLDLSTINLIGGNSSIVSNASLKTLNLDGLSSLQGGLGISANNSIRDISIPVLESTSGYLDFSLNDNLQTIDLPSLKMTGDDLIVSRNSQLQTIQLAEVTRIKGNLIVNSHQSLELLEFPGLKQIEGAARITYNDFMQELRFPALEDIKHGLILIHNNALESIDLSKVDSTGMLFFQSNESLEEIRLNDLEWIGSWTGEDEGYSDMSFNLSENPNIQIIYLPGLKSIESDMTISKNLGLKEIRLPNLQALGGDFELDKHSTVEQLNLPKIKSLGGSLEINSMDNLLMISMPQLERVEGNLQVRYNNDLEDLKIPSLKMIGGNCLASYNSLGTNNINQLIDIMHSYNDNFNGIIELQGQLPKAAPSGNAYSNIRDLKERGFEVETD